MKSVTHTATALALALALAGCASSGSSSLLAADAPRALPDSGPVQVTWGDPSRFSELTSTGNRYAAAQGDWLPKLATYLRTQAEKQLAPGHRLEVTIVDIKRAGQYEPWRGLQQQDVRIIRDIYPPRMMVKFRELDANGNVVTQGERTLSDPAFLTNAAPFDNADPLRYEKRMIDSWIRREFRDPAADR
jgi:hypothetical protein